MGNKVGSRQKSSSTDGGSKKSEVKRRPKKNGSASLTSNSATREKKVISCPDLSGAIPYKFDDTNVDVTIYRSYSNVAEPGGDKKRASILADPNPDIRVYRRSTTNLASQKGGAPDKSQTLPRSFGRNRHSMPPGTQTPQSNGTLPNDRASEGMNSGGVVRRSTFGGYGGGGLGDAKGSKRTSSTSSMASIGYKVHPEDFPDTSTIKRKLSLFESTFIRNLTELFGTGLSETVQMSLLSIAIRPHRANQQVSLWQYLQSDEVPANLDEMVSEDPVEYALTIPQILFSEVKRIRCENVTDSTERIEVAKQILACQAMEAANELSRSFEYQLALMPEGLPMELLGRHGAQCVYEYLKRNNRYLDRNTIVQGVVRGHLKAPSICPKFSIIIGERELKWNLFEIFKKPGLRKEIFLLNCDLQMDPEQAPWNFFASITSDPMLYGYRGLLVDWDFASSCYRLNGEDEASFPDEVDWRPDDFHRDYCPYRRLVGLGVMRDFCRVVGTPSVGGTKTLTLADYVKQIQGRTFARDRTQPVYRPIEDGGSLRDELPLDRVNLGNADTLRVRRSCARSETVNQADGAIRKRQSDGDVVALVAVATRPARSSAGSVTPKAGNSRTVSPRQTSSSSAGSAVSSISETNTPSPPKAIFNSVLPKPTTRPTNTGRTPVARSSVVSNKDPQRKPNGKDDSTVRNNALSGPDVIRSVETVTVVETKSSPVANSLGGVDVDSDFLQTATKTTSVSSDVVSRRSTITSDV